MGLVSVLCVYGFCAAVFGKIGSFVKCAGLAVADFRRHDGLVYSGYLSFILLLSAFPFLVFFTAITSTALHMLDKQEDFLRVLVNSLLSELPHETISALLPRINEILSGPPQSLLTVAIIGIVWTASSAIEGMRTVLNKAFRVSAPPPYILGRMLSILQFLVIILMMMLSVLFIVLVPIILDVLDRRWGYWSYIKYTVSEAVLCLSVAFMYFIVPNTRQRIGIVLPGAIVVTVLWTLSSFTFSWYLSNFKVLHTMYGNLSGIVASMMFFYILSIFFIYGAELSYRLSRRC
ncbi:YihY/virulence factor BrkB family protein [Anaplasma capra]|uniref:YihY/virulence factor BrkB family protein n=1 Tax=Anaplasma capra TaxID=1562740 RepID=UPI0021D60ED0|nr:YihY/virulence factor BrkB family protein [Anaplasma capra]MCU7611682.1 YihY/virulence factor BrkB family protein [Anaplasma capra]MCU7612168.1 YihY/virulence factor BrkB family protein [Anaplasma capra]